MSVDLDYQLAVPVGAAGVPDADTVARWVAAAVDRPGAELTVRVVGLPEMTLLNETYRGKAGPTNVLSFPFEAPAGMELSLLGDIVICASVVETEAGEQGKRLDAHWAHMVVHGCLHLLGYDHLEPEDAARMESLESEILAHLGYPDPWQ